MISATFRVQTKESHLIFDLFEDLIRSGRILCTGADVLHALELVCQILFDSFDEKMEVFDVAIALFTTTAC